MPTESEYIGSMVSIDCGQLGTYQGHVEKIDPVMNTLTISHAFHNGLRCDQNEVNLSSTTILDIKIIHASHEAKEIITRKATPSKMTKEIDEFTKPICTSPVKIIKAASKVRTGFVTTVSSSGTNHLDLAQARGSCRRKLSPPESPSKYLDSALHPLRPRPHISKSNNTEPVIPEILEKGNGHDGSVSGNTGGNGSGKFKGGPGFLGTDHHSRKVSVARRIDKGGKRGSNAKNNECFSAPADSFLLDFDFESNLALFNKKAVFQEIENGFPELSLEHESSEQKYRHDENILQPGDSTSTSTLRKQQIQVPGPTSQLYYTDSGLVVPSVSLELRNQVCEAASQCGLSHARQLEAYGRAASEMVLHLIGGSHRIHPKNNHQMPTVVVLCGPHDHGALGVCCARILSSHGVQVTMFMPDMPAMLISLSEEIDLYKLTGSPLIHSTNGLPDTIDLIVTAMDSPANPSLCLHPWYQSVVTWMNNSDIRAQVLALDPPSDGLGIPSKWSLCKVLPLCQMSPKCGSLYLCDLSIPSSIFKKFDIIYESPFGSKFVIPLYMQE